MNENSMNNAVTMRPQSGASLGRIDQYELIRELGGGGFGCVYLARDTVAGIEVAVKGLPPLVRLNKEELENVRQNFALVSRLYHPNIAAALTLHPVTNAFYNDKTDAEKLRVFKGDTLVVMQYARGVTLSQWRKQFPDGKVPLDKALEITRQIASALDYAHKERIIHRDIKPANVMIETGADGSLTARVLDFGLAAEIRSSMSRVSQSVTDTSGTRPYMAPEQWGGRKQGKETDLYSLAVLFYELVTGEVPFASVFDTGDPILMMNVVETKDPELSSDLPKSIRSALTKALAKKREDRFDSCMEFVQALKGGKIVGARASSRVTTIFATVAAIGLAVGGIWYWQDSKEKEGARIVAEQKAEAERKAAEEARRIADEKVKTDKAEAEKVLEWDANNAKANDLKNKALEHLTPSLKVIATIDGEEVRGAKLNDGQKDHVLPVTWKLERGGNYGSYKVVYERGGKSYEGTFDAMTADWHGLKLQSVALKEVNETFEIIEDGMVQLWEGGPYWAAKNIGADKPEDSGYYFWWGDTVGYKQVGKKWVASDGSNSNFLFDYDNDKISTYGKSISELEREGWIEEKNGTYVLTSKHDAARAHWGGNWRMPTKEEFDDLDEKCDWTWTTRKDVNGKDVNGYVVRGRGNYASKGIFLPAAGYCYGAWLNCSGSYGRYWLSVLNSGSGYAYGLYFNSGNRYTYYDYRHYGRPVRPVQGFPK